jgi:hypothetical protein
VVRLARRRLPHSPSRDGWGRATDRYNRGVCLIILLLVLGPRAVIVAWWLLEPVQWNATFGTFLIPLIGFVLLPWTTLVYVFVAPGGLVGFDYLWLAVALVADLCSHAGTSAVGRRRRSMA